MHELSLCNAIAATVREHAHDRRVDVVRLRVGHFRQIVPDTMQFCWRNTVLGGPMESARLEIVHVPAVVSCRDCDQTTNLDEPILRCDHCGSRKVELVTGDEFLVDSIDVAEPSATSTGET